MYFLEKIFEDVQNKMGGLALINKIRNSKTFSIFIDLFGIYNGKRVSRSAAELSYFLTLSIFPTLICIHAMFMNFLPGIDITFEKLEGFIPGDTLEAVMTYVNYVQTHNNSAMLTAGIIGMATSSAAAFRSIHNIMADIQGQSRFRGVFALLFSFLFSLLFLAAIYFAAVVMLAGNWLISFLSKEFLLLAGLDVWAWLRFPLMLVIFILIIYGLYRITAPKDTRGYFFTGAAVAAIVLVAVSIFFSWIIGISTRYPLVYSSLASIIIFMLWMYICGQILIMGNALNVVLRWHKKT